MKLLVFSNPTPGREDEYNEWYNSVHIPDLLKIPGMVGAKRYRVRPVATDRRGPGHRYLAVYELDGDPDEVMKEISVRRGTERMMMSEAIDLENVVLAVYKEI